LSKGRAVVSASDPDAAYRIPCEHSSGADCSTMDA
jgi:hypothetical protein